MNDGTAQVRVGVDVGGTFTDVVVEVGGRLTSYKLPSTPDDQSEAFAEGVRSGLAAAGVQHPAVVAHGTTVATNAVLERRGAVTALVTTQGFTDVLHIARQNRPSLYDLWADRPAPLVERDLTFGIYERIGPAGEVLEPMQDLAALPELRRLAESAPESIAVCLLFAYANPEHEERIREALLRLLPQAWISLSHQVLPEFREYERASTTVLDAYVGPVVQRYVGRIRQRMHQINAPVVVMRSGGATMTADQAAIEPVHTLLSGPAAGVKGALAVAGAAGFDNLVTFDMGGTSTDVCLVEQGQAHAAVESTIGGFPLRTPCLDIHTVGAGGGSIFWLDPAGALRCGPHSAGAVPGPACYGLGGGDPAVTDAHMVLGHLDPQAFAGGRVTLDPPAAEKVFAGLSQTLGVEVARVAEAGLAAVRAGMSKAIRVVTVERGRHPRDFTLVALGGAGPMHATALATDLEIERVLIPPAPGVLAALGLLTSPLAHDVSLTRPMPAPAPGAARELLRDLETQAAQALLQQGVKPASVVRSVDCRYRGQAHEVTVAADPLEELERSFAGEHRVRFGWDAGLDEVEMVTFRVRACGPVPDWRPPAVPRGSGSVSYAAQAMHTSSGFVPAAPVYRRPCLGSGDVLRGPCLVTADDSTVVIDDGWRAVVDGWGNLIVDRSA